MSEPSLADVVHEAVEKAKADEACDPDPREVTETHAVWHFPHGSTLSVERSLLDPDDPAYLAC